MLAVGQQTREYPAHDVNLALGRRLVRDVIELPGGHVGYVAHPTEFAHQLTRALLPRRDEPKTAPAGRGGALFTEEGNAAFPTAK